MSTPIKDMDAFLLKNRITQIVTEGYKRRSRQLPNNVPEIVDYLKNDLLKYMPGVSIETIDEAVTFEVLHDDKTPISPTFFFASIRKHYQQPTETRDEDRDELWQWKDKLRWLESHGQGNTPKADECRWWIYHIEKGDDEGETIALLDICAGWVKKSDDEKQTFTVNAKDGIVIELPAFNARREYEYLKMRKQLTDETMAANFEQALIDVNTERMESHHHRLTKDEALANPDVIARAKRLAVVDWLRKCNEEGRKPSDILTPLIDETKYQLLRREV